MSRFFFTLTFIARASAFSADVASAQSRLAQALAAPRAAAPEIPAAPPLSRRDAVSGAAGAAALLFARVAAVDASGGATAGKLTTRKAAKERYNGRVERAAAAFERMGPAIAKGDLSPSGPVGAFVGADFGAKDSAKLETPYADFQSAGYLLGNAYRSGQTTPPERLPQVKAFRGVQAEVELVRAAAKKQDAAAAGAHFAAARAALVTYLELVELPALGSSAYKGL